MDDAYFSSMYAHVADPWGFDTRFYERRKYGLTLAALRRPMYRRAYEPGCANGSLTERLAARCGHLTACDIVPAVVARARARLRPQRHVDVLDARFPHYWPDGPLDLIVWSEVAYYLSRASLDAAVAIAAERLEPDGDLVVVSYTGPTNYPQRADDVDAVIERSERLVRAVSLRDEQFRLDVWGMDD